MPTEAWISATVYFYCHLVILFITTNSTTLLHTPPCLDYMYIASFLRYYRGNSNEKKMDTDV